MTRAPGIRHVAKSFSSATLHRLEVSVIIDGPESAQRAGRGASSTSCIWSKYTWRAIGHHQRGIQSSDAATPGKYRISSGRTVLANPDRITPDLCPTSGDQDFATMKPRCAEMDRCLAITSEDAEPIPIAQPLRLDPVIPGGVDGDEFAPRPHLEEPTPWSLWVLWIGCPMSDAVLWFCKDILPAIRRTFPDLQFHIVGKNPPAEIRQLAEIQAASM